MMLQWTRAKECIKDEFKLSNCGFNTDSSLLVKSQWPCIKTPFYVTYRLLVAILFPVWILVDLVIETKYYFKGNLNYWFIYATNWGFIMLGVSAIFHAVVCIFYLVYKSRGTAFTDGKTPWPLKVFWALFNMADNSAVVISISYYIYLVSFDHAAFMATPSSFTKHSLNTAYVLFDVMLSATPVRLLHVVYTFIFAMSYVIFSVIYYAAGGKDPHGERNIYNVLNWSDPGRAIGAIVVEFTFCVVVQILLWLYYHLRLCIYSKTGKADDTVELVNNESSGILTNNENSSYNAVQERSHVNQKIGDDVNDR